MAEVLKAEVKKLIASSAAAEAEAAAKAVKAEAAAEVERKLEEAQRAGEIWIM